MSPQLSSRLAAVERRPEWERLRERRPRTAGHQFSFGCGALFGLVFAGIAVFIVGVAVSMMSQTSRLQSGRSLFPTVFTGLAALFALLGVGITVWMLFRWRRFVRAPLQAVPAAVLDKRLHVRGGGTNSHSRTNYHVTLEFRDGRRTELEVGGNLYGLLGRDDVGVAWIKDRYLLDFHRLADV